MPCANGRPYFMRAFGSARTSSQFLRWARARAHSTNGRRPHGRRMDARHPSMSGDYLFSALVKFETIQARASWYYKFMQYGRRRASLRYMDGRQYTWTMLIKIAWLVERTYQNILWFLSHEFLMHIKRMKLTMFEKEKLVFALNWQNLLPFSVETKELDIEHSIGCCAV